MEFANADPRRKEQASSELEETGFERLNHIVNSHRLVQKDTTTLPSPELYVSSYFEPCKYSCSAGPTIYLAALWSIQSLM